MAEHKPTTQDAQLILELFNLRRETELRKARRWIESEFWPRSYDEVKRLMMDYGAQENTWFRMVGGYWEMAASLVVQGALSPELFHANNQEMYFLFGKLQPFVAEMRKDMEAPEAMSNMEKVINTTPGGKQRLDQFQKRIKMFIELRDKERSEKHAAA